MQPESQMPRPMRVRESGPARPAACTSWRPAPAEVRWILPLLLALSPALGAEEGKAQGLFFKSFDRDGNGGVSRSEFTGTSTVFRLLDKNQDGEVTAEEIGPPVDIAPGGRNRPSGPQGREAGNVPLRERMRRFLERVDADGDGRISKPEWPGRPEGFERWDQNRDGFVDAADLPVLERKKDGPAPKEGESARGPHRAGAGGAAKDPQPPQDRQDPAPDFALLDRNGDGQVGADEWDGPQNVFRALDRDESGALSRPEMDALKDMGPFLDPRRFSALLLRSDRDRDGRVARDEFVAGDTLFDLLDRDGDGCLTRADLPPPPKAPERKSGSGQGPAGDAPAQPSTPPTPPAPPTPPPAPDAPRSPTDQNGD